MFHQVKFDPGPPYDTLKYCSYMKCYAEWLDQDPELWVYLHGVFRMVKVPGTRNFWGQTSPRPKRIEVLLHRHWRRIIWDITLTRIWPDEPPEVEFFSACIVPDDKPFDTGLLTSIWKPGIDYRYVRCLV